MTAKTKKIIFWVILAVLIVGLGFWLKYASFGVTVVTIVTGAAGLALGWFGKVMYDRYIAKE